MSSIAWHIENQMAILELVMPPANIMTKAFFGELHMAILELINHKDVKGIVICGRGRHFSAGADIKDLLSECVATEGSYSEFYFLNSKAFYDIYSSPKPIVAMIQGVCIGSALELAMACHFRIAGPSALLGFPEAQFNLMTGCGGTAFASSFVNNKGLFEMLLTCKNMNAAEALQLGLIDHITHKSEITSKTLTFVNNISENYSRTFRNLYIKKLNSIAS